MKNTWKKHLWTILYPSPNLVSLPFLLLRAPLNVQWLGTTHWKSGRPSLWQRPYDLLPWPWCGSPHVFFSPKIDKNTQIMGWNSLMAQWSVLVKSVILYCNILYVCPLLSWTTKYVCFLPVEPPVPELHLGSGFVMRPNDFFLGGERSGPAVKMVVDGRSLGRMHPLNGQHVDHNLAWLHYFFLDPQTKHTHTQRHVSTFIVDTLYISTNLEHTIYSQVNRHHFPHHSCAGSSIYKSWGWFLGSPQWVTVLQEASSACHPENRKKSQSENM